MLVANVIRILEAFKNTSVEFVSSCWTLSINVAASTTSMLTDDEHIR